MESDWSMRETGSCRLVCGGRPAHQLVVEGPRLVARTASPPQSGLFLVAQRTPEIACPPLLVGGRHRRPQQPRRVVDGDLGNLGGRRGHRRIRRHAGGQRRGRAVGGVERPSATSAARPSTRAHAPPVRFALSPSTPLGLHARRVRQARYLTTPRRARPCPGDCVHGSPHPSHQLRHSAAPPLLLSVCSPGSHPFLLPPCFPSRAGSSAYTFSPLVAHPSVSPSPPPPPPWLLRVRHPHRPRRPPLPPPACVYLARRSLPPSGAPSPATPPRPPSPQPPRPCRHGRQQRRARRPPPLLPRRRCRWWSWPAARRPPTRSRSCGWCWTSQDGLSGEQRPTLWAADGCCGAVGDGDGGG